MVTCHNCRSECKRDGRDRKGVQRFKCRQCSKVFLEPKDKALDGMYLPIEKAELVMKLLLEGKIAKTGGPSVVICDFPLLPPAAKPTYAFRRGNLKSNVWPLGWNFAEVYKRDRGKSNRERSR